MLPKHKFKACLNQLFNNVNVIVIAQIELCSIRAITIVPVAPIVPQLSVTVSI